TPPLMLPVPFIRSFSSKLATSPPCQTRYTVPVGFSHEGSITIAPSSTFQLSSPDQPFSVLPSQRETQPSCSWKSIGSGCRKPPPPPPPARPLPAPCGAPFGPAGEVPGACAGGAPGAAGGVPGACVAGEAAGCPCGAGVCGGAAAHSPRAEIAARASAPANDGNRVRRFMWAP